eukprot:RCo049951
MYAMTLLCVCLRGQVFPFHLCVFIRPLLFASASPLPPCEGISSFQRVGPSSVGSSLPPPPTPSSFSSPLIYKNIEVCERAYRSTIAFCLSTHAECRASIRTPSALHSLHYAT